MASSPAVAEGVVYVGSFDGKVYALESASGAFMWSYPTGNMVVSSPAVAEGVLYVGSYDHMVYAFGSASDADGAETAPVVGSSGQLVFYLLFAVVLIVVVVLAFFLQRKNIETASK